MAADPASASSAATLTIGAVCKVLGEEFDDISISKIRFLEDQKLIAPARTPGGYRLYSNEDVERLRSILRLQRDEFLPLAVIRDMLSQGHSRPTRRRRPRLVGSEARLSFDELASEADAEAPFIRELIEYGLLERGRDGEPPYTRVDIEIVALCSRLGRYGVAGRHLPHHPLRGRAARPACSSRSSRPRCDRQNPERREAGLEELEALAELTSELTHLLLVRDLRQPAR